MFYEWVIFSSCIVNLSPKLGSESTFTMQTSIMVPTHNGPKTMMTLLGVSAPDKKVHGVIVFTYLRVTEKRIFGRRR